MSHDESIKITVDVRATPPGDRHALVFRAFDKLSIGDVLELIDDHDPRSLLYQFQAEDAGEFTWNYLNRGPEAWRVRIGKVRGAARRSCGCADRRRAGATVPSSLSSGVLKRLPKRFRLLLDCAEESSRLLASRIARRPGALYRSQHTLLDEPERGN